MNQIENEEVTAEQDREIHVPFDGFVNVNHLIQDRRSRRLAEMEAKVKSTEEP